VRVRKQSSFQLLANPVQSSAEHPNSMKLDPGSLPVCYTKLGATLLAILGSANRGAIQNYSRFATAKWKTIHFVLFFPPRSS
jgi:hypothetical protein